VLFEENPLPMWVFDVHSLKFLAVNEAMVEHYGFKRSELLQSTIKKIRPPEEVPGLLKSLSVLPEVDEFAGVWPHRKKDGTVIMVEIYRRPVIFEGKDASLVLANDVTDRLRIEQETRKLSAIVEHS
jgi:PAS domain S-box-containing protein